MRLHIERNQEPKNDRPRYFEATFRLEMDEAERAIAARYCGDDHPVCELTDSMVSGPDMDELLKAKGLRLGKLSKGVTLRNWIDTILKDEQQILQGCRDLEAFMKAALSYQGGIVVEI